MIISIKHDTCQLPNDLRLKIRKDRKNPKTSWNYNIVSSLPPELKILSMLEKNC